MRVDAGEVRGRRAGEEAWDWLGRWWGRGFLVLVPPPGLKKRLSEVNEVKE